MSFGKGRKEAPEWMEVLKLEGSGKLGKVKCKHCSELVSGKIERIRMHLSKCIGKLKDSEENLEKQTRDESASTSQDSLGRMPSPVPQGCSSSCSTPSPSPSSLSRSTLTRTPESEERGMLCICIYLFCL